MARPPLTSAVERHGLALGLGLGHRPFLGLTREPRPHEMHLVLLPRLSAYRPPSAVAPNGILIPNGVMRVVLNLMGHATITSNSASLMVLPLGAIHSVYR